MELWYPQAKQDKFPSAGKFTGTAPWRGVLHTMEGTYAGSRTVYARDGVPPQFSVEDTQVYQHMGLDEIGKALVNLDGGVETNRLHCIQIEVAGYATKTAWTLGLIRTVRDLMAWIEQQTGVKPTAPRFIAYPASYGPNNGVRMAPSVWNAFNGWCGHMHVPENLHGDPGSIPISALLERPPKVVTPMANAPFACILIHPDGGYLEIGEDGGVFNFGGAPFFGSLGGIKLNAPIVDAAWTPTHQGYYMVGKDGGIFAFGDAHHQGNAMYQGALTSIAKLVTQVQAKVKGR